MNAANTDATALVRTEIHDAPSTSGAGGQPTARPARDDRSRVERSIRLSVLAESLGGVGLLLVAQLLQPQGGAPFVGPQDWAGWLAAVCGFIGVWLVPSGWLSAVMLRTGIGPVARFTTRVGSLLAWYALAAIVATVTAQGALATDGVLFGLTSGASIAACIGIALGLLPRPTCRVARSFLAAAVGGVSAQVVIWLATRYWTYQVNYDQIHRLDWLIVLGCALLSAAGQCGRLAPRVPDAARLRRIIGGLLAITTVAAATVAFALLWPTTQHLPSEVSVQQVNAPAGVDFAIELDGIGPESYQALSRVSLEAFDDLGRPALVNFRPAQVGGTPDRVILLGRVDLASRARLCMPGSSGRDSSPVVTVRDQSSGVFTQVTTAANWCTQ